MSQLSHVFPSFEDVVCLQKQHQQSSTDSLLSWDRESEILTFSQEVGSGFARMPRPASFGKVPCLPQKIA